METLTNIILPIILASIFIYWLGTFMRLIIHVLFNKD